MMVRYVFFFIRNAMSESGILDRMSRKNVVFLLNELLQCGYNRIPTKSILFPSEILPATEAI
jgi:hypothetical protein